ncbi:G-patch domain-containing protein [Mycena sanguinolenta]|uniref:G-patch domain-containing protein n=1 Tax=Mycena sanguinolenta TaxID=230812 RepID=A0A8H7D5T6_9AGAR|nr:G-patch domain-containing protein [Mycena sanguinolenta]
MSLNDKNLPTGPMAVGVYPGVANPTSSSMPKNPLEANFVTDPTTSERGAGAGPNFEGDKNAKRLFKETAGVIEAEPGIIESTNVHPLRPDSNDDDGWAHATVKPGSQNTTTTEPGVVEQVTNVAAGGAKMAYGYATGNEEVKRQGTEQVYGK